MLEVQQYQYDVVFEFESLRSQLHSAAKKQSDHCWQPACLPSILEGNEAFWSVPPLLVEGHYGRQKATQVHAVLGKFMKNKPTDCY